MYVYTIYKYLRYTVSTLSNFYDSFVFESIC